MLGLPHVLAETTGGSSTAYLYGHDLLAEEDTAWAWHLGDGLGSVRQLTDGDGDVTLAQGYTPFGVLLWQKGSGASGFGYAGEQEDASVGLVFLRARYYDPGTGRFIQKDVWKTNSRYPGTLNAFVYVLNNAPNRVDPTGHSPSEALCFADGCDPNQESATQWLLARMRENAVSSEARTIRFLNTLALAETIASVPVLLPPPLPPLVVPCPTLSISLKVLAYKKWIEMVRRRAPWDFKDFVHYSAPWGGENIRMCCRWYQFEAVANIHYGYVGRAAGFSNIELKVGAGAAQYKEHHGSLGYEKRIDAGEVGWHTYFDEPEDRAGIQIGLDLYNHGVPLTPKGFCETFNKWASQLKPPRWKYPRDY